MKLSCLLDIEANGGVLLLEYTIDFLLLLRNKHFQSKCVFLL